MLVYIGLYFPWTNQSTILNYKGMSLWQNNNSIKMVELPHLTIILYILQAGISIRDDRDHEPYSHKAFFI